MQLISDHILEEELQREPASPEVYPSIEGFNLTSPSGLHRGAPL